MGTRSESAGAARRGDGARGDGAGAGVPCASTATAPRNARMERLIGIMLGGAWATRCFSSPLRRVSGASGHDNGWTLLRRTLEPEERRGRLPRSVPCAGQRIAIRRQGRVHGLQAAIIDPLNRRLRQRHRAADPDWSGQTWAASELGAPRSIVADRAPTHLAEVELHPCIDARLDPGPGKWSIPRREWRNAAVAGDVVRGAKANDGTQKDTARERDHESGCRVSFSTDASR